MLEVPFETIAGKLPPGIAETKFKCVIRPGDCRPACGTKPEASAAAADHHTERPQTSRSTARIVE